MVWRRHRQLSNASRSVRALIAGTERALSTSAAVTETSGSNWIRCTAPCGVGSPAVAEVDPADSPARRHEDFPRIVPTDAVDPVHGQDEWTGDLGAGTDAQSRGQGQLFRQWRALRAAVHPPVNGYQLAVSHEGVDCGLGHPSQELTARDDAVLT